MIPPSQLDDEILHFYRISRNAFLRGDLAEATRYYRRNRAEHAVDLYYEVDLPRKMRFIHPMGSVLGRATYGEGLAVYQNVSVGSTLDGTRPVLGNWVVLFPGAKILGGAVIGSNVFVSANTVVYGKHIPDNSIVSGNKVTNTTRSMRAHFFPEAVQ